MELRYSGEITIILKMQFIISNFFEGKYTKIDDATVLSAINHSFLSHSSNK